MRKKELTIFRNKYINYLKKTTESLDLIKWIENAIDFEGPDGYYFDFNNNLLVIFEHFEIDCSERPKKKGNSIGSILHKNYIDTYKEIKKEIQSSKDYYESTKIIEQGYYEQKDNNKIYYLDQNGDKYRNNFINNFYDSFENHHKKLEDYKSNIFQKLNIQPLDIKVCFLIEDKTIFGTYYSDKKNWFDSPVILTETLQFQEIINNSSVNYVIFGRQEDKISSIGYKGDSQLEKIDLSKKEFFVIPAVPVFTASKQLQ